MRKCKLLSVLLSLCLILCMFQGALASSVNISAGNVVRIPLKLHTDGGNFSGVQFFVRYTSGLEYQSYALSNVFAQTAMPIFSERPDGSIYIGVVTSGNFYEPAANGDVDICDLIFSYPGSSPQVVTVFNITIIRLTDDLKDTIDEDFGPISYQISPDGVGGGGTGTPSGGGGGGGGLPADTGAGGTGGDGDGDGEGTEVQPPAPTDIAEGGRPAGASDEKLVYAPFISGYPDGTVLPDGQLSRAELTQLIYNLYGAGGSGAANYSDMDQSHWAFTAVGYCQAQGYMLGYPAGDFRPEQTVTRAELSTTLARIKGLTLTSVHPFSDIGDHWGIEFIGAASAAGYILGYPDGTFRPENPVTRAEAVTMICRAEERDETLFDTNRTFTDLSTSFWGYNYIMNAANGYNYNG